MFEGGHRRFPHQLQVLEDATTVHLRRAQATGIIRPDIDKPELIALITSACIAADRQQWNSQLRQRVLTVIFDGLRPR